MTTMMMLMISSSYTHALLFTDVEENGGIENKRPPPLSLPISLLIA